MPGVTTILVFCAVSFVLVATPGPGVLHVVGEHGRAHRRRPSRTVRTRET
jgi:threonine/homoserine/homoserine lactone efflux protein